MQRAYLYIDHKSIDNEILTRFVRRINNKLSFEIAHLFEQRKYDEDFYEYVCEYYDYNKSDIRSWKIFKNTCELYVKCLNTIKK